MSIPSIYAAQLAMILGSLALVCWIGAGLMAVLGAAEDIKHIQIGRTSQLLTTVFTGAGVTSAVAMIAVLVFVWL
ncbi:F0F1-type ATP synthase membrane subunit c/vacuolar-type H+-ATPase subunit K [Rhizobium leguminosarum]